MNKACLSLGTNRGDRFANLKNAANHLSSLAGKIIAVSSIYETPPWRMRDDTDFLNQVLLLETNHTAIQLMDILIQIETSMGRVRTTGSYEPRIIDLDVLYFNDEIFNDEKLTIPHPLIHERRFVLEPLAEIAPEFMHPVFKKSMKELLGECGDKSEIRKLV
jgi:2-amino-4-hydroxy-6-hydroxymethyldihydropteridine diphosphokinase